uniref:NADH dehydrogenase [ubiquinone] 1 beta subcomplex subunit 4 n=1 Tax=Prolemur simus TaxID=1328070 RepID=A0A8C8YN72_PROSS
FSFPTKYTPWRLAAQSTTLDLAERGASPETRQAQGERLAITARLKREYLLQYNDPSRRGSSVELGPLFLVLCFQNWQV